MTQAQNLSRQGLATAMHATRCFAHQGLKNIAPGSLAFRRDMFLELPLLADIVTLQHAQQALVDRRLLLENSKRISHDFRVGEQVLKKALLSLCDKLKPAFTGPFEIITVHTNGTCTIRILPNVTERINIRRLKPYQSPP